MNTKQKIAIVFAPFVFLTMLPVFCFTGDRFGSLWGWYAGFLVYWPVWCMLFPIALIGTREVLMLFKSKPMPVLAWLLVSLPPIISLIGRLSGRGRAISIILWITMAVVNSTLEEVLWRGIYTKLFPESVVWGVLWPSLWFGIWHFAPGMLSMGNRSFILVVGAVFLGLGMGWVAHESKSIRWTVISHVLASVIQA